jgi:hypothetical protein
MTFSMVLLMAMFYYSFDTIVAETKRFPAFARIPDDLIESEMHPTRKAHS